MKLFRLNKNRAETVPAEVQDYYRSERRERTGLAWLLALGTLIVTVLIASGLFFGGRWVYRKVAGPNSASTSTTQQEEQGANQQGQTSSTNTDQSSSGQTQQNQQQANPQQPTGGSGQQTQGATTPQPTPQTLVNTGPSDELEQEQ